MNQTRAKIIPIKSSKGGVGRTSISVNLGRILASDFNKRVLLIDLDPQSNLSSVFVPNYPSHIQTSYDLLCSKKLDLNKLINRVIGNLDIIVSDPRLTKIQYPFTSKKHFKKMYEVLEKNKLLESYDLIIMDMTPNVSDPITKISLACSDLIIAPYMYSINSVRGFVSTINDLSALEKSGNLINLSPKILAVPNNYHKGREINSQIESMMEQNLDSNSQTINPNIKIFTSEPIKSNQNIEMSYVYGKTAIDMEEEKEKRFILGMFSKVFGSHAKKDFKKLAEKIIEVLG
ncbi:MAG: ParA family protein [Candidatus Woesearchaeota archaeon]|jgi:chromosome partitioning protein|nr:ParA family protein [Candidatus Woesearchaeota archaeon]